MTPRLHAGGLQNLPGTNFAVAEDDLEASYGLYVRKWLTIMPDFQYVIDPGAPQIRNYHNATVVGLQTTAVF